MSTELFKHILEALKLAPKYLVAVGIVLTFLLFGPRELLQALGVQDVAKDYRSVVRGLLLCGAILGVGVVQTVYAPLRRIFKRWQSRRHIKLERLKRLTEDEKQILRFYIANQSRSNKLRFDDGIVQGWPMTASFFGRPPLAVWSMDLRSTSTTLRGMLSIKIKPCSMAQPTHGELTRVAIFELSVPIGRRAQANCTTTSIRGVSLL